MNDHEMRQELENAYEAGVDFGLDAKHAPDFEEWFDATYGGPDCE